LSERQKFAQGEKHKTAFRFGEVTAVNSCGHPCQLGLTNAAALAHAPKQFSDSACRLFVMIFRTKIGWSADLKNHVTNTESAMAADTSAIVRVLACVAAPAGDGFAVTNRGEKLKCRHGFPLNMLEVKLLE
jgi:hypothetical protein